MTESSLASRYSANLLAALCAAILGLVPACSSSDKRPLVLVSVQLGGNAASANKVEITVAVNNGSSTTKDFNPVSALAGRLGVYLPANTSGTATVTVSLMAGNTTIATKTVEGVSIVAGETTLLTVDLSGGLDAGAGTGGTIATGGVAGTGGAPTGGSGGIGGLGGNPIDASAPDVQPSPDAPALPVDGNTQPDTVTLPADAPVDAPAAETAGPDVAGKDAPGSDSKSDAAFSTMALLGHCTAYQHTLNQSSGKPEDSGIRSLSFSPDGTVLVSAGWDGRVKLWNVAGTTLQDSGVVFTGDTRMTAAFSTDGKYVATGDLSNVVAVYDLAGSLAYGLPSRVATLSPAPLSPVPLVASRLQFTSDNNHLIALYAGDMTPDPNQFVVWDLGTQTIVRNVKYAFEDWPMAIRSGAYTDPMWVASAATYTTDAGGYASTVTLMDVASASPAKAQFAVPASVSRMAFSPDGTTLAIGTDDGGELGLWDITNKSNVTRLGSPLVADSGSSTNAVDALAYSGDGKYLAAGIDDIYGSQTVRLISLQPRLVLEKTPDFFATTLAFSPDSLGLAVGEGDNGVILYCRN